MAVRTGLLILLLLLPSNASSEGNVVLFPDFVDRLLMADPDNSVTAIRAAGDSSLLQEPVSVLLSRVSLAYSIPVIEAAATGGSRELVALMPVERVEESQRQAATRGRALSDQSLSVTVVGSGLLDFSRYGSDLVDFRLKLEGFFRSPVLDDYVSDGNALFLVLGYVASGSIDAGRVTSLASIADSPLTATQLFADVYVVGRSTYSDQVLILRLGVGDLAGPAKDAHVSVVFEMPPLFQLRALKAWFAPLENVRLSAYASAYGQVALADPAASRCRFEIGLEVGGDSSGRAIALYGSAELGPGFTPSGGLKLRL